MAFHVQYGLKELVVPDAEEAAKLAGGVLEHWSTWTTCLGTDPNYQPPADNDADHGPCRVCSRAEELEDITNEALNGRLPAMPINFYLPTDNNSDNDMALYIWQD